MGLPALTPAPLLPPSPWLPYWAVLAMDVRQTARGWLFRAWVLVAVVLSQGYLLHRAAVHHEAGLLQTASGPVTDFLQYSLLAAATLVVLLSAGALSGERGSLADAVLCRGISRHQYFLGKLHGRLVSVLGSFLAVGLLVLLVSVFVLRSDLAWGGSLLALVQVAAVLGVVVAGGVAISAMVGNTVLGIALCWLLVYAILAGSYLVPVEGFGLAKFLRTLPLLVRGQCELAGQLKVTGWLLLTAGCVASVGMLHFSRRDV